MLLQLFFAVYQFHDCYRGYGVIKGIEKIKC